MAKTSAPLMGFGAAGQLGKSIVFSSWRGVKYARRHVIPANPQTNSQTATRNVFSWLSAVWKRLDPSAQAAWTLFALGQQFTDRNAWVKSNLFNLRGTDGAPYSDLALMLASPGAKGGLAAGALHATDGGTHHAVATLTAPTLPTGWLIVAEHAIAIKQQDANTDVFYDSYYATDVTTPYAASILTPAAGTYAVFAWFEYTKPDGSSAYSPSQYDEVVLA